MHRDGAKPKGGENMSTTYYICRKQEYDRAEAIKQYIDRINRTLNSYLDTALPPELKDDLWLTDELEDAVAPMCNKLREKIGCDPEVRFCTITGGRIVWHKEETGAAGFQDTDELVVIDEYGEAQPLKVFL